MPEKPRIVFACTGYVHEVAGAGRGLVLLGESCWLSWAQTCATDTVWRFQCCGCVSGLHTRGRRCAGSLVPCACPWCLAEGELFWAGDNYSDDGDADAVMSHSVVKRKPRVNWRQNLRHRDRPAFSMLCSRVRVAYTGAWVWRFSGAVCVPVVSGGGTDFFGWR